MLKSRVILGAILILMAIAFLPVPRRGSNGQDAIAAEPIDKKRTELWQTLISVLPKDYEQIDVYAENVALNTVLLYSHGEVIKFTLTTKRLEKYQFAKVLGRINRITFSQNSDEGTWTLWSNGAVQSNISNAATGVPLENASP